MWDTSIMHYVNFMMSRGLTPYRDIVDVNLPGAYFMEGLAMHVFGGGDLAWRLYDYTLLLLLTGSLIVIARPYDWFAGLFSGIIFLLIHGAQGPYNAGQREQLMITLIIASYALLFTSMRSRTPLLLLPFGFILGIAASLKPTAAPVGFILLLMVVLALRKRGYTTKPYILYGIAGALAAASVNAAFFYRYHVFADFLAIAKRLIPYYASVGNLPRFALLQRLLLPRYCVLILMGLALTFFNRKQNDWENWERIALGLGVLFGIFSYVSQGKPFEHHSYPFLVFLILWSALEFSKALKKNNWLHSIGLVCYLAGILYLVPVLDARIAGGNNFSAEQDTLKADLIQLGGPDLQHQVQCFDMVSSCFSTLYHLQLMPYTTFMGDYMFFGPHDSDPLPYYRNIMWDDLQKSPPQVIVVTKMWLCEGFSYEKLDQWPELEAFLDSAYILEKTRAFGASGYQVYVLKNSPASLKPPLQATLDAEPQSTARSH